MPAIPTLIESVGIFYPNVKVNDSHWQMSIESKGKLHGILGLHANEAPQTLEVTRARFDHGHGG